MASTKANDPGKAPQAVTSLEAVPASLAIPSQPTGAPATAIDASGTPDLDLHFHTPTWVRPDASPRASVLAQLPVQAEPVHERIVPRPDNVPEKGRWVARHRTRTVLGLVMLALLAGTAAAGWYVATHDRQDLLPYFGIPAVLLVGLWAIMINSTPTKLELKGSLLTVRHHGRRDVFDLADSGTSMSATPTGEHPWSVQLECVDGSSIKLTERQFKAEALGPVFDHFARISRASMAARLERYRR
jgi:hypothetical protein